MFKTIRKIIRLWKMPDPEEHRFAISVDNKIILDDTFARLMYRNVAKNATRCTLKFHKMKIEIPD